MEFDMYRFGSNLNTILRYKGRTQKDLAKAIGGSEAMVSKWMHGVSLPSTKSILKISYIYDVSIDELMEGVLVV